MGEIVQPGGRCTFTKRNGEQCKNPAGAGTDHLGWGVCRWHGGTSPSHMIKASRDQLAHRMRAFGTPLEIDPGGALLGEVKRSAGIVGWLEEVIAEFSQIPIEDLRANARNILQTMGNEGREIAVWVKLYQEERKMLRAAASEAIRLNIAERHVQLAEEQGRLIAHVIQAVLGDPELALTAQQRAIARPIVQRHLSTIAQEAS